MSSPSSSHQQTNLDTFVDTTTTSDSTTTEPSEAEANAGADVAPDTSPPPDPSSATLPDLCEWADEFTTINGVTVAIPADDNSISRPGGGIIRPQNIAYVVDADELENYRDQYAQQTIDIPKYYSRLDDFDPVLTAQTAESRKGGYGITASTLRDALRALAGTGRYKHDAVTITACGRHRFIAEYHDESTSTAYLFRPARIAPRAGCPITDSIPATNQTDDGITIPDDHPDIAPAVTSFKDVFEAIYGITLTAHIKQDQKYHYFEAADGMHYKIAGHSLLTIHYSDSLEDLPGEYTFEPRDGEEYTASWNQLHYEFGDSPWENRTDPAVIAGKFRYLDPRSSSKATLSSRIKAYATYIYLELSPQAPEHKDIISVKADVKDERIGRFKPPEDTASPLSP